MYFLDNSLIIWINRPYLDMGDFNTAPWHIYGIDYNYRNLVKDTSNSTITNPVTIIHPISFRESLIHETRLFQYEINNPLQLPEELRTERWNNLCNYLTRYEELEPIIKIRVIALLSSLCLHKAVLEYVPEMSESEISHSNILAGLAFHRAMSNLMSREDAGSLDNVQEFENIANHSPVDSGIRFGTAIDLVALYGKTFRNLKATEYWANEAARTLDNLKASRDNFEIKRLTSIYHRAAVFIPMLQGNKEVVVQVMDLCQSLAEDLTNECKNETERMLAHENLTTVFESRTKEALWLNDIDLAEERAKKMLQMEPLYSRYRLQLGEVLIKQGKFEEACKIYRSAARLGPPGTAIAWFMAGQCHEKLGEIDIACDCYLASVEMDELAISAVERINKLAPNLGNSALANWSNIRLLELREEEKIYDQQTRTSYIPEASSELKRSGQAVRLES